MDGQASVWVPPNVDRDKAREALLAKGYKDLTFDPPPNEAPEMMEMNVEVVVTIGRLTQRLAAKVPVAEVLAG